MRGNWLNRIPFYNNKNVHRNAVEMTQSVKFSRTHVKKKRHSMRVLILEVEG